MFDTHFDAVTDTQRPYPSVDEDFYHVNLSIFIESCQAAIRILELEREIFQIAAMASPKSLPTILLVTCRFRTWKLVDCTKNIDLSWSFIA